MNETERRFLMWGQLKAFSLTSQGSNISQENGQLVKVAHEIPNLWRVYLWLELTSTNVGPPLTDENLFADFSINFGVGEAQTTRHVLLQIVGQPGGAQVLPAYANSDEQGPVAVTGQGQGSPGPPGVGVQRGPSSPLEIPAQSINIGVIITATSAAEGRSVTYSANVGAFVAPRYYPGNARLDPPQAPPSPGEPPTTRWMGPGFQDEPLHYKR